MASKWSTALVLPPSAMTVVMALSKALGVMMSKGLMSRFSSSSKALHHKQTGLVQSDRIPRQQSHNKGRDIDEPEDEDNSGISDDTT